MTNRTENRIEAVDSLSAYEFEVALDGQIVGGIFSVSGLTGFLLDGDPPPLMISKMVQQNPDAPFNKWIRESLSDDRPTREVAIIAMDEGRETRRWIYKTAHITRVAYSDFNTALSELVEERITIQALAIEVKWA